MTIALMRQKAAQNRLLTALAPEERERLLSGLEVVALNLGDVLYQPGERIRYVMFPTDCVLATTVTMRDGATAEAGMIGREGMVGLGTFLDCDTASFQIVVQTPGEALRLTVEDFRAAVARSEALHRLMHRYAEAFLVQVSYSAACNSLHTLEQRCCRWLLMSQDRVEPNHFHLTQEVLARQLGVHRTSVTEVAHRLQESGLIRYSRGKVTVLDRKRLEAAACECYGRIKAQFDTMPRTPQHKDDLAFGRLLENLPAAAYACDGNGKITAFNQGAAALWGREPRLNDPLDRY